MEYTAEEIIRMDLDAIYIGNLNTVDDNLILPEEGKYGSRFVWISGEERFLRADGVVHRPLYGMGNRKVILTAEAFYEGCSGRKEFAATVLQETKETVVAEIRKVELEAALGEVKTLPSVVIVMTEDGRQTTLPVTWEPYEPLWEAGVVCVKGTLTETDRTARAVIKYTECKKAEEAPIRKGSFFPLNQVRLLEGGLHYEYQQRMLEYLLGIDENQMLYNFRKAAGLDTLGAEPMTGWDEEGCKLRGHTTGHYLSGLGLAWAATGDERFLCKIERMADGLYECQEAFSRSGKYHRGFLSAYSEEQFDLLEQFRRYPEIWAPYYTLDKIMSGLYDCCQFAGSKKALDILSLMGDWVYERLSGLSGEILDRMWAMYIAGEFGGMLGTMVKLYQLTGKESHLAAARLFYNAKLFYPMEVNCDTLEDMHANQHIPQVMGAMELFRTTGEAKYWKIAEHFWNIVTEGHTYCIGGVGETELFHRSGTTCSYLSEKSAESCASYHMLRLTAQLFEYTMDGKMMDYYDNTLRNHILASCSHTADGGTTYFMPLGRGQRKEYSTTENTCCHGTGMESRFRYMEHIYAYDRDSVYINLFIPSVLSGDVSLEQRMEYGRGKVCIRCNTDLDKKLKVHIPEWAEKKFTISVNGHKEENSVVENGYVVPEKHIRAGDEIVLQLPMEIRILENKSDRSLVNLAYGPYLLAVLSEEKDFIPLPDLNCVQEGNRRMHFIAGENSMIPFAEVDREAYHVYLKKGIV